MISFSDEDINFFNLFSAIAVREKTLKGMLEDNAQKYFFIVLRDLEEIVKFKFINIKENKNEE